MLLRGRLVLLLILVVVNIKAISLKNVPLNIVEVLNDTQKINFFNKKVIENLSDSALSWGYAEKAASLANQLNDSSFIILSMLTTGDLYSFYDDNLMAIIQYKKALDLAKETKDTVNIGKAINNIGTSYYQIGSYKKALEAFFQVLSINEKIKNKLGIAFSLGNIAVLLNEQGYYEESIEKYERVLRLYTDLNNKKGVAFVLNNMGTVYDNLDRYQKAIDTYLDALNLMKQVKDYKGIGMCYSNIGESYEHLGEINKARNYTQKGLKIFQQAGYKEGIRLCQVNSGRILIKSNKFKEAISLLLTVLKGAEAVNDFVNLKNANQLLAKAYQNSKNYEKALMHYKRYVVFQDSLLNEVNQRSMMQLKIRYETEKKEIENISLKEKNTLQKEELKISRRLQISFVVISILIFALLLVLLKNKRNFKKQKQIEIQELLSQIKELKANRVIRVAVMPTEQKQFQLDKDRIKKVSENRLNASDWKILDIICDKPTSSNKEIADGVSLSVEGVKSALKKMYDIFEITASGRNKKLALVIVIMQISENNRIQ